MSSRYTLFPFWEFAPFMGHYPIGAKTHPIDLQHFMICAHFWHIVNRIWLRKRPEWNCEVGIEFFSSQLKTFLNRLY